MPKVVCPACHKKIHPPDHLAGHRVTCPRCEAVLVVPDELAQAVEEASTKVAPSCTKEPSFPPSARLGIIALALGSASILVLCLPFIGYVGSIGLSGIGLLVGLNGLNHARMDGSEPLPPVGAGSAGLWGGFGSRARDYPLAGVAACLLALILALLPTLSKWLG